jgi:hypothetical protein
MHTASWIPLLFFLMLAPYLLGKTEWRLRSRLSSSECIRLHCYLSFLSVYVSLLLAFLFLMQCRFHIRLNGAFVLDFLRLNAYGFAVPFRSIYLSFSFYQYYWYLSISFFLSSLCRSRRSLLTVSHSLRFHFRLNGGFKAGIR